MSDEVQSLVSWRNSKLLISSGILIYCSPEQCECRKAESKYWAIKGGLCGIFRAFAYFKVSKAEGNEFLGHHLVSQTGHFLVKTLLFFGCMNTKLLVTIASPLSAENLLHFYMNRIPKQSNDLNPTEQVKKVQQLKGQSRQVLAQESADLHKDHWCHHVNILWSLTISRWRHHSKADCDVFFGEVSGPCAQPNRVDTPNSPNFGL